MLQDKAGTKIKKDKADSILKVNFEFHNKFNW